MYFSARKSGAPAFVGPLDALIAQGATLRHASSVRRLLSSYTGPACRLTEEGSFSEADIPFLANGELDLQSVNNLKSLVGGDDTPPGGFEVTWRTAYDQSVFGNDATQTTQSFQPIFSAGVEAKGAMQGTGGRRFLSVDLNATEGTLRPFFVIAVVNIADLPASRVLLGLPSSSSLQMRQTGLQMQNAWGTTLQNNAALGKQTLGFLVNGANSANYRNGVLQVTGDSGLSNFSMTASRIGSSSATTTTWFHTLNNTISEFIVFNGDPTTLPGWPAFVAAQNAYFGIA